MTILVLTLVLGKAALIGALGWLAWTHERSTGWDAFHLVPILAGGTFAVARLDGMAISPALRAAAPFAIGAVCMVVGVVLLNLRAPNDQTLLVTILMATVSLVIFDAGTAYTPQVAGSLPVIAVTVLTAATLGVIGLTWMLDRGTRLLALGEMNRWVLRYWRAVDDRARSLSGIAVATYLSWVVVLAIPLQSTGVLSSTIFKNVVFAVLVARVASVRGVPVLLATAFTLAGLVTAAGFFLVSRYTPAVIEATTLVVLFAWAQRRTERSKLLNSNAR